jgi:hypothetical protein
MAMIRVLTSEYSSFRSSLMMQAKITRDSLATVFRIEKTNRSRDAAIAAAAAPVTSSLALAAKSSSAATATISATSSKPSGNFKQAKVYHQMLILQ